MAVITKLVKGFDPNYPWKQMGAAAGGYFLVKGEPRGAGGTPGRRRTDPMLDWGGGLRDDPRMSAVAAKDVPDGGLPQQADARRWPCLSVPASRTTGLAPVRALAAAGRTSAGFAAWRLQARGR